MKMKDFFPESLGQKHGCTLYTAYTIPVLWVLSPVGTHTGGNWSMFFSHIDVSLFLLSCMLSLKSINISSGENFKKMIKWNHESRP